MKQLDLRELEDFYVDHLFNVLVPFWMERAVDWENGGYFTCFTNTGEALASTNKYVWSQGRYLWMVSHLAFSFSDYSLKYGYTDYINAAENGAKFLKKYALLPNGHAAWTLDQAGNPIVVDRLGNVDPDGDPKDLERGITADIFLVYGMAEYARAANDMEYFEFALSLFHSIEERFTTGEYLWFPQAVPKGYQSHALSMIMLETAQELAAIAKYFNHESADHLTQLAYDSVRTTMDHFLNQDQKLLFEFVKEDGSEAFDELLASTVNPGHSLEDAWFILHFARTSQDKEVLQAGLDAVRWMAGIGWDDEFGGIPQFMHMDGTPPHGKVLKKNEGESIVREIQENWYNKLWWVHSEALYALILAYELDNDPWYLETYWKIHEYVFNTFPNPNKEIGEWIQIRNREGEPESKVVALPVKDPYHITRAFMHLINSLERINSRNII